MKYKSKLRMNGEDFFDSIVKDFCLNYHKNTGHNLSEVDFHQGIAFSKKISKNRIAKIKILDYEKNRKFRMEYSSCNYHKISGVEIEMLNEDECVVIFEEYIERMKDGKSLSKQVYNHLGIPIKKPNIIRWIQLSHMVNRYRVERNIGK